MSINVEYKSFGPGTCQWCGKEKDEVFDVVLSDKSFIGLYCRVDLMKAVTMKCERRGSKPTAAIPVGTMTDPNLPHNETARPLGNNVAATPK